MSLVSKFFLAAIVVATSFSAGASAASVMYNFTATADQPIISGGVTALPHITEGLAAGQIIAGSLTYDPNTPLFSTEKIGQDLRWQHMRQVSFL